MAFALLFAAALAPRAAEAQFDLVGLYQDKVKGFEAIYYLEEDETWARDRRVFEAFGTLNMLDRDEDTGLGEALFHWNAGLLVNVKPRRGRVQLTMFSMANQLRFLVHDVTEMLHGGRVTIGELLELSLGGYWLLENTRQSFGNGGGSVFLEVNLPFLSAKSSYVLGQALDGDDETLQDPLLRFDLRWSYSKLRWLDDVEVKAVRYNVSGDDNVIGMLSFTRLGLPGFRFLSGRVGWSFSESRLATVEGGLDVLAQFSEDFNASRRGHFGTSIGLELFGTYASPLGYRRFRPRTSLLGSESGVPGFKAQASFQIPMKWLLTAIAVVGSGLSAAYERQRGNEQKAREHEQTGARILKSTVQEPEDELFTRLTAAYTYNDPTVLEMFPGFESQHRLFFTLGIMY